MAKGITVPVTQTGLEQSIQGAAKKVGSISIPIDVDAKSFKNLSQPLGRITGLATEFEKSIAASNARVIAFGASVGIINGVQNALTSLVTTTIEVQKNLTSIGVIFGKTNEELGSFSKGLFAVARETAQSFQTASEAALEFSRQGLSTEETLKRTKDALTLTRFTSLSAADAVDVLTAAVNSFSSSGVTTSEILNKLVAVDTRFAVSSEDLAKGLSRAGSIAQEVGVSLDQLNSIITVVQEKTARGGAVIGNAFKTIFTRIRSDETIKALQEIGIFSRDASGNLRPVVDILTQLAGKLNGLSEIQKIEVLEAVASKYNINSLNALLDDLGSSTSKFQEISGISAKANNEAYTRQVELNKTLDATIKQTVVSVSELANSIGEIGVTANLQSLLEFFNDVISGINDFINSESIGGDIAKSLISGISGVLFKIGLPILGAIFIKLTKDIAQFGVESLKTILGVNQQVKERQALEQAVVNTLIRDRDVMAAILALSGDRAKQEEYLLNLYNRQIAALQQVQSIAGAVAPGLVQAGLSATSGSVQKKAGRAAEGYLPAQEAADVKRGVGGADKNAKVVKIPNFSFGGGKKGTMYANSSEYVVPNYNGGDGTAIFNKDMVRKYGMPDNAKKINAANGYIPNFIDGKYIYDSDRLPADKNVLLKKILASKVKKNLILGPAGTGKTTFAAAGGTFITKPEDADKATEIDILSGGARTKDGGISANLESIISAVNLSGGKVSYLYAGNMDIIARRIGREEKGVGEGDLRSEKQIAGTKYAPLNQFDFIDKVKSKAKNFGIVKNAATGYIPNFAQKAQAQASEAQAEQKDSITIAEARGRSAMLVPDKKNERIMEAYLDKPLSFGFQTKDKGKKLGVDYVKYHTYGLNQEAFQSEGLKKSGDLTNIEADVQAFGLDIAKKYSYEYAAEYSKSLGGPATGIQISDTDVKKAFLASKGAVSGFSSLGGGIFETAIRTGVQGEINKDLLKAQQAELGSGKLDFKVTDIIKRLFGVNRGETDADSKIEGNPKSTGRAFADQIAANALYSSTSKVGVKNAAAGYIPNFAKAKAKKTGIGGLQGKRQKFDFEKNVEGFASSDDGEEKTAPSILGGRVFESRLNNQIEMNLAENKVKPDVSNASFINWKRKGSPEAEAKLSVAAGLRDKRLGIPVSKGGKGNKLIVPSDAAITENLNKSLQSKNIEAQKASGAKFSTQSVFRAAEDTIAIWENVDRDRVPYKNIKIPKQGDVDKVVGQYQEFTTKPQEKGAKFVPNYAEKLSEMYDWDGTIIPKISGKSEEYIQSLQKLQTTDLLPIGKELAASKAEFDIATIRPIIFREPIKQTAQRLGLKVDKIFPVGSMFDNRRTQGKKGERKLYGPERKALLAEGTGRSIVDDEEANLAALGSRGINANLRNRAAFGFVPNFAQGLKQQDVLAPSGQFYDLDTADAFLAGSSLNLDPASPASKGLGQELKKKILASARKVYGPKAQIGISRLPGQREAFTSAVLANPALADDFIALQKATTGGVGPAANTQDALAKFNNPTPFDPTPWPAIRATGGKARAVKKVGPASLTAAFGFVPNFADPLKEAVDREISAGIKPSQVRVTQDDRLMTTRNPEGIAVINTRDEPNGKVPSNRINEKNGRKAAVAMAAKGFIPNFAGEGQKKLEISSLDLGLSKTDLKSFRAALAEATIKFSQTNKTVEEINNASTDLKSKIIEIANQYKIGADKQGAITKKADELIEARKNIAAKNAGGGGAGGGAVSVASAGEGGGGRRRARNNKEEKTTKEFDAGKFLLLQSAIVGATSAIQAFTDETSNAALGLEFATGAIQGVVTGLLIPGGLAIKVISGIVAAGTSLIPAFGKLSDKLKTEEERIVESLAKLGEEARKTGESVAPEKFLAAFEIEQKKLEQTKKTETVGSNLEAAMVNANVNQAAFAGLSQKEKDSLIAGLSAANIKESVDIEKLFKRETFQMEAFVGPFQRKTVEGETRNLDVNATLENIRLKVLEQAKKKEEEIAKFRTEQELLRSEAARKTVAFENEQILKKLKIQQSIFDIEQSITEQFSYRNIYNEQRMTALEQERGMINETVYLQRKFAIDKAKIESESIKQQKQAALNLKKDFSGLEGGLGNIFGNLDLNQLNQIADQLAPTQYETESKTGKAGQGAVGLIKQFAGEQGINIDNLNNLSKEQRELILKAVQTYSNALKGVGLSQQQAIAALEAAYQQTQTAGQKQANEINALTEVLKKGGNYQDRLNLFQGDLIKSVKEVQVKNLLEVESGRQLYESQLEAALSNNQHVENMRQTFPIEKRAQVSAVNLNTETEKKIDAIEEEIINTALRLKSERTLTAANNRKLKAENDAYNEVIKNTNISLKFVNARENLIKSERDAEEQNQAEIKLAPQKLNAETDAIKRTVALTEARNTAFDKAKKDNMASAKLSLARANLTKTLDEAEVENQVAIEMIRDNFNADAKLLEGKIKLAKSTNDLILQTDYNALVLQELTLEGENLVVAQRKAAARLTQENLEVGTQNSATRIKTQQSEAVASIITEGDAYRNLRFGRGTLESQAKAAVAGERIAGIRATGREPTAAEQYEIANGINNSVAQNLKVQKNVLLDQADTFQDIIGKQTPQLFADGMAQAMEAALSQADDLGSALRGVATGFLKSLQGAFLQSASKQIVASVLPNALPFSQGGIVKGYATGGLVTGGSGYKDDVPAMLSEGEYVIRKSSVQKYGKDNLTKLNSGKMPTMADGGFFLPGFRGQESISGIENLQKFASQTTTSGATDVMKGGASSAFINLEDQSMRLSRFALLGDDTINQEIRDAQQSALDAIEKRRQYDLQKKEESKQFKKQIIGTVLSAALSYGVSSFLKPAAAAAAIPNVGFNPGEVSASLGSSALEGVSNNLGQNFANLGQSAAATTSSITGNFLNNSLISGQIGSPLQQYNNPVTSVSNKYKPLRGVTPFSFPGRAYGGQVARYAAGGGTKDDVPALLMGGEYVMSNQATKKYGKQFFDSINQGRAPRFAAGGEVGGGEMLGEKFDNLSSKLETRGAPEVNITVNVTSSGASETKSQGESNQGGIDYKKMSERIKAVVIETINEEKRLGGSLRPRG